MSYLYDIDNNSLSPRPDAMGFRWCVLDWPDGRLIRVRDEGSDDHRYWIGYVEMEVVATGCRTAEEAHRYALMWAAENPATLEADNDA